MSERPLEQLTHEQLIQTVTERLGEPRPNDSAESLYVRNSSVPAARIHPYPKRRREPQRSIDLEPIAVPSLPDDVRYSDFLLVDDAQQSGTAARATTSRNSSLRAAV